MASRTAAPQGLCDDERVPTVLVVDDHPSFRASASALLQAEGYEVVGEAADGREALEALESGCPDVVLLDVQLPDIDGFEVAAQLRDRGCPARVVLVSSRDGADFGPLVEESGAVGFIPKSELCADTLAQLLR